MDGCMDGCWVVQVLFAPDGRCSDEDDCPTLGE
jgi:hypothetical protein